MNKKAFSLVELIVVIGIISILSTASYVAIQKMRENGFNNKTLGTLPALANILEQYAKDHYDRFPIPVVGEGQNMLCYNADATYSHDCEGAAFIQGFVDSTLLTTRYMDPIPADPYTGSRYAYGVTLDGKYFQIAGLYREENGTWSTRTADNLHKGFELPSLIRAYDGPNFVVQRGTHLPYSPEAKKLSATVRNYTGTLTIQSENRANVSVNSPSPVQVFEGYTIATSGGTAELYFSDGSVTTLEDGTTLTLSRMEIAQNDDRGIITKIRMFLRDGGRIWSKVVRLAEKSEFQIETQSSIAGVRGTEFGIDGAGNLQIRSGEVWVRNTAGMNEEDKDRITKDDPANLPLHTPATDPEPSPAANTQTYYPLRLTTNIVPHIIEASRNQFTIQNLYVTLGLDASDPRTLPADLSLEARNKRGNSVVQPLTTTDRNPYVFNISGLTDPDDVAVRFITGPQNNPSSASSFTFPIGFLLAGPNQAISERDIYKRPWSQMALLVPERFRIRSSTGNSFTAGIQLKHLPYNAAQPLQATLRVESESAQNCAINAASPAALPVMPGSNGRAVVQGRFIVDVLREGECKLTGKIAGNRFMQNDTVVTRIEDPNVSPGARAARANLVTGISVYNPDTPIATAVLTGQSINLNAYSNVPRFDENRCRWNVTPVAGSGPIILVRNFSIDADGVFTAPQTAHGEVEITCTLSADAATGQMEVVNNPPARITVVPDIGSATIQVSADPTLGSPVTLTPQLTYNDSNNSTLALFGIAEEMTFVWIVTPPPGSGLSPISIANSTGSSPQAGFTPASLSTPNRVSGVGNYTVELTATFPQILAGRVQPLNGASVQTENVSRNLSVGPLWVLGDAGQSCDAACTGTTNLPNLNLLCIASTTSGSGRQASADWNDAVFDEVNNDYTDECRQCVRLVTAETGSGPRDGCNTTAANRSDFAPFYRTAQTRGNRECVFRKNTQDTSGGAAGIALNCGATPNITANAGGPARRVCQCE